MLLKLLFRNAFRRKLRTALTIGGMCVALLSFGLLRTVIDAWYAGVAASAPNRLVTRNAISLAFSLPLSYRDKIEGVEGVETVSYGNWFGGIYIDKKNFFANFAVEPRSYLSLYPEFVLSGDEKEGFLKDRRACIAGRRLAKRFGWRIGDSIALKGVIYPGEWTFVLRGIYRGRDEVVDENQLFFHWDYLNETLKRKSALRADKVGFYIIGTVDTDRAAATASAVDKLFKNSFAETLTETEKAFQMGFVSLSQAILTAIKLVSLVVIVIIMAVVANTMAMAVRERMGEYAVFKTLGFGGVYLTGMIAGESLLIAFAGALCGIVLTFPAVRIFSGYIGDFFPLVKITPLTIYLDLTAAAAVGAVASMAPVWKAVRMRIADGLGRIG